LPRYSTQPSRSIVNKASQTLLTASTTMSTTGQRMASANVLTPDASDDPIHVRLVHGGSGELERVCSGTGSVTSLGAG
jgi:hypothetical protein